MKKIIPPNKEELEELLFEKLWTKKQIREYYKVSKRTFHRWMIQYDLIGKIDTTEKVDKWKKTLLDKNFLKDIDSLECNIISKNQLEYLLFTELWSEKKICEFYEISRSSLRRLMNHYKLTHTINPIIQNVKRFLTIKK